MNETHVVFGATGALGAAVVRQLTLEQKLVRAVVRDMEAAKVLLPPSAGIVAADARADQAVHSACQGASVVYHCVNVRHSHWLRMMPKITENLVVGALKAGARLVFPGSVIAYGPLQRVPVGEDHPLAATSKKGGLRATIEGKLLEMHQQGTARVVIPRFPHFIGPNVTNPVVAPLFEAALVGREAGWPANLDAPHDFIFVDDAARACVLLGSSEGTEGQAWHVPGAGPLTGRQLIDMAFAVADNPPKMRALSRFLFRLFGIFIPDAGEMIELLYLYERPMLLDGEKFAAAFPSFEFTPHGEAVRQTVEWFREHRTE